MSFRPESAGRAARGTPAGEVDYRLARNSTLSEFRKGRLTKLDVCDAHPELMRAARNVGRRTDVVCPICEAERVVEVTYVFGPRLPASGRTITTKAELTKLNRGATELAAYVVEACPGCAWNHLARSFPVGGRSRRA